LRGGLKNAFSQTFENVGTNFHWKNSLRKKLAELGLMELYNMDESFHLLTRERLSLSGLPLDQMLPFWVGFIDDQVRTGIEFGRSLGRR
jgi:hypothetical protein